MIIVDAILTIATVSFAIPVIAFLFGDTILNKVQESLSEYLVFIKSCPARLWKLLNRLFNVRKIAHQYDRASNSGKSNESKESSGRVSFINQFKNHFNPASGLYRSSDEYQIRWRFYDDFLKIVNLSKAESFNALRRELLMFVHPDRAVHNSSYTVEQLTNLNQYVNLHFKKVEL